jgi:hypothetical protein
LLLYLFNIGRVVCNGGPGDDSKWSHDDDEDNYGVAEEEPEDAGAKENHLG